MMRYHNATFTVPGSTHKYKAQWDGRQYIVDGRHPISAYRFNNQIINGKWVLVTNDRVERMCK